MVKRSSTLVKKQLTTILGDPDDVINSTNAESMPSSSSNKWHSKMTLTPGRRVHRSSVSAPSGWCPILFLWRQSRPMSLPNISALQHWQQITLFYERCYFSHLTCARMIPTLTIGSSIIVISNLQYRIHWQSKINVSGTHNLVRLTKNTGWHSNTSLIEKFNPPCQKQVDCVKWRHSHYHRRGRSVALLLLLNWFSWQNKHYITVKL